MKFSKIIAFSFVATASLYGQTAMTKPANSEEPFYRYFVDSTLLMLGNFVPGDPNRPDFAQVILGYRITPKNVVF